MVHLGSGDITAVRTGDSSGLQGGAESGNADLGLQPSYRLPQNCSQDQVPKAVTNVWRCAEDDDTTYDAGTGLGLDSTTFSVLPRYRLRQGCDPASVAKLASGEWVCAVDEDTTYSAGRGVALDGTTFSLPTRTRSRRRAPRARSRRATAAACGSAPPTTTPPTRPASGCS